MAPLIPSQQLLMDAQRRMDEAKLKAQLEAEGCIVMAVDPGGEDRTAARLPRGDMVVIDIDTRLPSDSEILKRLNSKQQFVEEVVSLGNRAQRRRAAALARRK